jgi:hypothetical protein
MTQKTIELRVTAAEKRLLQKRADQELNSVEDWGKGTLVAIAAGTAHVVVDPTHPDNRLEFPRS